MSEKLQIESHSVNSAILFACGLLFVATLLLPMFVMNTEVVSPMRLHNLHKPKRPTFKGGRSFVEEKLQKEVELWFLRRHGLWGHMVRLDNQLNLELFNQISSKYKSALKVGRDKWLFQKDYLDHFNRVSLPSQEVLEARALRLKRLQDLLRQRGIGFSVLLSTSKIEAYPELVPSQFFAPKRNERPSTYERVVPMLNQLGVSLLDSQQLLKAQEGWEPMKYFSPAGSHWNDVGACEVVSNLAIKIEEFLKRPMVSLDCREVKYEPANKTDLDLVIMANLLNRDRYVGSTPYPIAKTIVPEQVFRPKLLVVGSSFGWSIMRFLDRYKIIQNSYFWYYYKRARHYPTKRQFALKKSEINWERDLLKANYVVIEANLMGLDNIGFDFVEDAIAVLENSS